MGLAGSRMGDGLIVLGCAGVFALFFWRGMATGVALMRGSDPRRDKNPVLFWLVQATWGVSAIATVCVGFAVIFGILPG